MAKVTVPDASGKPVVGESVNVMEVTERFSEIKLEDGTEIRLKTVVLDVVRADDRWDDDGNPIYVVKSAGVMNVKVVDDSLKKGTRRDG